MRLAIVHHDLSVRGGAERLVCEVGDRLERRGHEIVYATSWFTPDVSYPKLRNKKVVSLGLPLRPPGGYMQAYFEAFNTFRLLLKAVREIDVDILLFSKQYSLLHIAKKLRDLPGAMYVHWPERLSAQVATTLRRLYRKPIELMEVASFSNADAILCNSMFTSRFISAIFGRKAVVAYPGVDLDFFRPSGVGNTDERLILSVNRFVDHKNLELAVEAMSYVLKEVPEAHLILAGSLDRESYDYYAKLRKMVDEKGLDHAVEMVTDASDTDMLRLYQKCAVFLYTPLKEHFGIGPIEAMACGKPVSVSDSGGPKESVIHGITGFTLPNDPETWAVHIIGLLQDSEMRNRMGRAARRHVERNFTWEKTVDIVESVLDEIVL